MVTNEELVELYQGGDSGALEKLIEANKGFIYKVSMKFFTGNDQAIDQEDLLQEGRIGLIVAAEKYNVNGEVPFVSYAYYWIYQKMHRFMYPKLNMVKSTLKFVSLNTPIGEDGEMELGDMLGEEQEEFCGVEESVYNQELKEELGVAISEVLNQQQKQVVFMRYGFDCNIHTLEQAGKVLGVTKERVRQVEVKSLRLLRNSKWGRMRHLEFRVEYGSKFSRLTIQEENARRKEEQEKEYNYGTKMVEQYGGIDGYIKYMREEREKLLNKMQLKRE